MDIMQSVAIISHQVEKVISTEWLVVNGGEIFYLSVNFLYSVLG